MTGQLLSESNDPAHPAVVGAHLLKSQGIDAVNGRTIPQRTLKWRFTSSWVGVEGEDRQTGHQRPDACGGMGQR